MWPWLVLMGQCRGGLYNFDALDNLVGCNSRSGSQVLPDHQQWLSETWQW